MKVTTQQAAEILGITRGRVFTLIERGLLKDHKVRAEGAKKHYASLDSKEVREFAKTDEWKKLRGATRFSATNGNGHGGVHVERVSAGTGAGTGVVTMLRQIRETLDVMNDKLDHLRKVWE